MDTLYVIRDRPSDNYIYLEGPKHANLSALYSEFRSLGSQSKGTRAEQFAWWLVATKQWEYLKD